MHVLGYLNHLKHTVGPARVSQARPGILAAARNTARKARAGYRHWATRRAVVRELRAMPDWALRDIGVERAHIREVAESIARKERETGGGACRTFQGAAPAGALKLVGCG